QVSRNVGDRLPLAERRFRLQRDHRAPKLARCNFKGRARAERRLFEEHRDMPSFERVGGGRTSAERSIRLQLRRESQTPIQVRRIEIEDRQEVLACMKNSGGHQVRYSALIRTYSALRSHVHTVDDAVPAPRSTVTETSAALR